METEITLQRLAQYGLAAHVNDADGRRALEMLGFTRTGTGRPHLLPVPLDRQVDVAQDCVRLLSDAGYNVTLAQRLIQPDPRPSASTPSASDADPSVIVTRHPVLGVVVTTATPGAGESHPLIAETGFHHVPHLGLYTLPFGTPLDAALHAVDQLTARLAEAHTPVTVSPGIQHPVPGQKLTNSNLTPPPTARTLNSPDARLVDRIVHWLDSVGDRVVRAFRPQKTQPQHQEPLWTTQAASPGTAWVQVPARNAAFTWSPPSSLPTAAGVTTRAQLARLSANEAAGRPWWDDGPAAKTAKATTASAPRPPRR
ncbi:hypothetical protein [Streptacidiphilus neutrinimicus]|uniref:hypothetical protein n=1 Tax=Streptacidiphilus neutrinimicus TaxID=105420 RepID=UPI0005AA541A|nr:hypothetical protein [Streptacidiphilus neutrinimicus]